MKVDGPGNEILTHSAFTREQNCGARRSHTHDRGEDFLHLGAAPDDILDLVAESELLTELFVFVAQRPDLERLVNDGKKVVQREWLRYEIRSPGLHRLYRRL